MPSDWSSVDDAIMDPQWYADNEIDETFRRLRDEDPVHLTQSPHTAKPFWAITRYQDVRTVMTSSDLFSSRLGGSRPPRTRQRLTPEERHRLGFDVRVTFLDPPWHTAYRRPLNKHFSVPAVKQMTDSVVGHVDSLIDELEGATAFDLIDGFASELPVRVVANWLGLPEEEWAPLRVAAARISLSSDPRFMVGNDPVKTWQAGTDVLVAYSAELARKRRDQPADDFATVLTQTRIDEDQMSPHEVRAWFATLILGGFETTRNAIGVGLWQLLANEKVRQQVEQDPALLDPMFDEIMRWTSPARHGFRIAREDTELGGKLIRANDWIVQFYYSANHDERVFANPNAFDITRTPHEHLAFGEGIHKCLGRHIAKLEVVSSLQRVLERLPNLRVTGEPQWSPDTLSAGLRSLPVER